MTNLFLFFHNTQRHSKLLYSSLISIFSLCCRFRFKNAHTKRHIKHKKKAFIISLYFSHTINCLFYTLQASFSFLLFFFLLLVFISFIISLMQFILLKAMLVWLRSEIGNWNRCDDERAKKTSFSIELIAFSSWRHNQSAFWCPAFCGKIKSFFVIQNHNNWPRCCLPLSLLPSSASDWNNFAFLIL